MHLATDYLCKKINKCQEWSIGGFLFHNHQETDNWEKYADEIEEPRKIPDIEDVVDKGQST